MERIKRALTEAAATAAMCVTFSAAVAAFAAGAALVIAALGQADGVRAAAADAARLFG